ncbi:ATP-binding protein [Nocardioides sp. SR21]|uniref:ATP-binding protein n=1 Tax=Nocardioides sp. SR21 TaxID=2919501 RepID=UPI001FAA88D2|nr:ATP-binding protein [Nocardioides sp. SR21]
MTRVRLLDLLGFMAYFLLAAFLGRLAVLDGTDLALVWPAAGVAAAWLAVNGWSRWLVLDVVLLFWLSVLVNVVTGASFSLSLGLGFANVVQVLVFGLLITRWCPTWWGSGEEPPLGIDRIRDFGFLLAASFLSALVSAALGPAAVISVSDASWELVVSWVLRNGTGVVAVFPLALLARHQIRSSRPQQAPDAVGPMRGRGPIELAALVVVSAASFWLVFVVPSDVPLPFLVLAVSVWAGARYPLGIASAHALAMSAAVTAATVLGEGPFAEIADPDAGALALQAFIAMIVVLTLALSVGRGEILQLSARLVRSERTATEQAALVGTIVDTMADGVSVIDADGTVVLRNPAAESMLGSPRLDASGRIDLGAYGLLHPDGSPVAPEGSPFALARSGQSAEKLDFVVRSPVVPGGRQLEVTARPLPDTDPPMVVAVFHDVTSERRERDELASFAGVVAHDLLNPLTVIDGWTEALLEEAKAGRQADAETQIQRLDRILRAAQRMQHLISDLLAYTTARDLTIKPVRVDLAAVATDVARARVDAHRVRGLAEPVIAVDPGLPAVLAEPVLLRQVVDNLIGNSVKYVAPGVQPRIEVVARRVDGEDGPMVEVEISDNGIGIPDGQHESVFDTFHRAHTDGYRGSGLGLSIVKRIVERHGGTATARDNDGRGGTTMCVTFPAAGGP